MTTMTHAHLASHRSRLSVHFFSLSPPSSLPSQDSLVLWEQAKALRLLVFVKEMHVPVELEVDEADQTAIHLGVKMADSSKDQLIATLRLVFHGQEVKLGRVVVHANYRKKGIGREMMQVAIQYCQKRGVKRIVLGAQTYITSFYERLGFQKTGDIFDDAGIPHIGMFMELSDAS